MAYWTLNGRPLMAGLFLWNFHKIKLATLIILYIIITSVTNNCNFSFRCLCRRHVITEICLHRLVSLQINNSHLQLACSALWGIQSMVISRLQQPVNSWALNWLVNWHSQLAMSKPSKYSMSYFSSSVLWIPNDCLMSLNISNFLQSQNLCHL